MTHKSALLNLFLVVLYAAAIQCTSIEKEITVPTTVVALSTSTGAPTTKVETEPASTIIDEVAEVFKNENEATPGAPPQPVTTTVDPDTTTTSTTPTTTTVDPDTTTVDPNTTTTSTTPTTTTIDPNTTTTSTTPTTTTVDPNNTTTVAPNKTTTVAPVTSTVAPDTKSRRFDGASFIGGMVLATGLMCIGLVAWKFYRARTERNYHTL